ncbi:MAG: hypothetical protein JWL59_4169 [Chthoniobacteraceae bacterium]|nr:hypothetical protein [Chthoniobacteraceae bacterium]
MKAAYLKTTRNAAVVCGLRNSVIFVLSLIVAGMGIDWLLPEQDVPTVTAKLAWLAAHRDAYDVLFIGSSRVRRQISPAVFDATMAARGFPTCSVNLGVDAMTFPELGYLLDRVVEILGKQPRLRMIVTDLNPLRRELYPVNAEQSLRAIYWHDFHYTMEACRAVLRDPKANGGPSTNYGELLAAHLNLMMRRYCNLGRCYALLQAPGKSDVTSIDEKDRGYFPVDELMKPAEALVFDEKLAAMKIPENRRVRQDPVLEVALERFVKKIESTGAHAFFVAPPVAALGRSLLPRATDGSHPVTFEFDDPVLYESLYAPAKRYDAQHLNLTGSTEFTQLLANRIADSLEQGATEVQPSRR